MGRKSIANRVKKKISIMNKYQLLVFIAAVIVVCVLLIMNFPIAALISSGVFAVIILVFSIPQVKGKLGEKDVSKRLLKIAKKYDGFLIDDVIIPADNGMTSQLDHVLLLKTGIFVIETKSYAGRIYGSDSRDEWTQSLAYGNVKNKFYSPVKQNNTHIYHLSKLLNMHEGFYNVVFFLDCGISHINSQYVYNNRTIKKAFEDKKEIFSELELIKMSEKIFYYKQNKIVSNKEHIANIKVMKDKVQNNICPRCGKELVLRTTKDGRKFYGCSGYPKCKFTKNI